MEAPLRWIFAKADFGPWAAHFPVDWFFMKQIYICRHISSFYAQRPMLSGGETRQRFSRPLVGSRSGAWDRDPGFHPLPPQTVRAVLLHTAFRQPSPYGVHVSDARRPLG